MRRPGEPPSEAEEPAASLFRALLAPWPSREIKFRLRGAEDIALSIRAIRTEERLRALGRANACPSEVQSSRRILELLACCLYADEERAFSSARAVGNLDEGELAVLGAEALDVLAVVSPTYDSDNVEAWKQTLERGARAPANLADAFHLGGCVDNGYPSVVYRPERYWGVPVRDLLDGHWMVFRAARSVVHSMTEHSRRR